MRALRLLAAAAATSLLLPQLSAATPSIPAITGGAVDPVLLDLTSKELSGGSVPVIVSYAGSPATATHRARTHRPAGAQLGPVLPSIGARAMRITNPTAFWRSITVSSSNSGTASGTSSGTSSGTASGPSSGTASGPSSGTASGAVLGTASGAVLGRLDPAIARIDLDQTVRPLLDHSVPRIGAPAAWQRGLTGTGVKVAVLDTGIDADHPDLAGKVVAARSFTGNPDVGDQVGHGTHVASIIAGTGAASGGRYRGVAPDATLLNAKVLDNLGTAQASWVIAAMEWATSQGAKVVNLSIGATPTDGADPMSRAVNTLSFGNGPQAGPVFVAAAGDCANTAPYRVMTPAAADAAVAVGNLLWDGGATSDTCYGPRVGDSAVKPDIGAPGTDIVAARAAGTSLGFPVDENYTTLTGTSMATPHVAGTAALLVQAQPGWSSAQRRARLISTADLESGGPITASGAGMVDADQATTRTATVDQAKLEFGRLTGPVSKPVTYRNPTPTAVTLDLAAFVPGGTPPTLSTPQVVVPANGQATVTVTATPGPAGIHIGALLATPTDGTAPLTTLFGWRS